jgi:esterase/lipase superfamily enzyme
MGNALPANICGATDEERGAETQQRQQKLLKRIEIGQWMTVVVPLRSNGWPNWRTLTAF